MSLTDAVAVRADYPSSGITNYFIMIITYASSEFSTSSYNMES
jgi:hypothetical protein